MLSDLFISPVSFLLWGGGLLIAIAVHEFAHAWVADRLGDPTARLTGRLTLNPLVHLDPLGTLVLLIARFGWGKPVPIDPYNLSNPKRDLMLISLAGPASNIIFAGVLGLILWLVPMIFPFLLPLIILNLSLALFNLLPFHPLDGGKILVGILPDDLSRDIDDVLHQYSTIFLIFLIVPVNGVAMASRFLTPILNFLLRFILSGFGSA